MAKYREPMNGVGVKHLPERLKAALAAAQRELPPGTGLTLFAFDFGEGGALSYISNARRDDMVRTVGEWLLQQLKEK